MTAVKWVAGLLAVYVLVVAAFETWLGIAQPAGGSSLAITTTDKNGDPATRIVSRIDHEGRLYVSANHWPRAWYRQALAEPDVLVDAGGGAVPYHAVPVDGAEAAAVEAAHPHKFLFRVLTGFPPRRFIRLDPR